MRALSRLTSAVALGLVVLASMSAGNPPGARACSCMPWPESLAAYRTDEGLVIVKGTVLELVGSSGVFGVEQVFKGPVANANMPIEAGDPAMCGIALKVGQQLIMTAYTDGRVLQPSSCSPHAILPSPEGDAMLADAERSYGITIPPGIPIDQPGTPVEPTDPPSDPSPAPTPADLALPLVLGGALALALVLFGGIALLARRRASP